MICSQRTLKSNPSIPFSEAGNTRYPFNNFLRERNCGISVMFLIWKRERLSNTLIH